MDSTITDASEPQIPAFRPGKKRKIYRHRAEDTDDSPLDTPLAIPQPTAGSDLRLPGTTPDAVAPDDEEHAVSEIIRLRARKGRLGGVAFRAGPTRADEHAENTEQGLVPHDGSAETAVVGGMRNRFAPQTGLVGELVNRHM